MTSLTKNNWIAGTLELASKVRYGITSRGVPLFRFVPYDTRFPSMAVGCSSRNLFYNVHAIVCPEEAAPPPRGNLQKATLIQNLGEITDDSETQLLVSTYVHDSQKELRKTPSFSPRILPVDPADQWREPLSGFTFNIDPPGCRDVDDTFTIAPDLTDPNLWFVCINIADVSSYVPPGSELDLFAMKSATSFYTLAGSPIGRMLPPELSEGLASLLPGSSKKTLSLCFTFSLKTSAILNVHWKISTTTTDSSFTYDEALEKVSELPELQVLRDVATALGASPTNSHEWVEKLMIFYNTHAAELLFYNKTGILRRHQPADVADMEFLKSIGVPEHLAFSSAEFCLPTDPNVSHWAIGSGHYTYASSPIRRYVDLFNQRALKAILTKKSPTEAGPFLVSELNRRQKQSKAFQRDLFFLTALANVPNGSEVAGIVVRQSPSKTKVWVPSWNRMVNVRSVAIGNLLAPGTRLSLQWYSDRTQPNWKSRIVFRASEAPPNA